MKKSVLLILMAVVAVSIIVGAVSITILNNGNSSSDNTPPTVQGLYSGYENYNATSTGIYYVMIGDHLNVVMIYEQVPDDVLVRGEPYQFWLDDNDNLLRYEPGYYEDTTYNTNDPPTIQGVFQGAEHYNATSTDIYYLSVGNQDSVIIKYEYDPEDVLVRDEYYRFWLDEDNNIIRFEHGAI